MEPYWQTQERGVPRKYYRITEAGREKLARSLDDWFAYVDAVTRIVGPRGEER